MNATPETSSESSSEPPCTFFVPIIFKGNSSSSCITASTTILEKNCFCWAISFELNVVCAHFSSRLRSSVLFDLSILIAISSILFKHNSHAFLKLRIMICGCRPSSMKLLDCLRNSAANRTTDVVPSPT